MVVFVCSLKQCYQYMPSVHFYCNYKAFYSWKVSQLNVFLLN